MITIKTPQKKQNKKNLNTNSVIYEINKYIKIKIKIIKYSNFIMRK
jgi:hypothetical protein